MARVFAGRGFRLFATALCCSGFAGAFRRSELVAVNVEDIERTAEAVYEAHGVYRKALDHGVNQYLMGPSVKPVDRKYN